MSRELPHPITVKEALPTDVRTLEETRNPDPAWHFRLAVRWPCEVAPHDASPVPKYGEPKRLLWLRRAAPPHDIQVFGHYVDKEVDPHHYLEDVLRLQGREAISTNPIALPSGMAGDIVATWEEGGQTFAGRFFASKWGPRIFILSAQAKHDDYKLIADDFFDTITSFEAIDDSLGELAELVVPVAVDVPVKWKTHVPDSWRVMLTMPDKSVAGFTAANLRGGDLESVDGMLSMGVALRKVARKPRKAARMFLDAVKHNQIQLENQDFIDEPCKKPFQRSWCCVTPCEMEGAPGEMRCRVMMSKHHWVVAGVLGPRRADDAASWAENKRALDIATATLELK